MIVEWMDTKERQELDDKLRAKSGNKWDPATWGQSDEAQAALTAAAAHARVDSGMMEPVTDGLGPMWGAS